VIKSIQVGRGVAAIGVATYHTYLIGYQKTGVAVMKGLSEYGYLGVPFFFVLSGFIIALAHHGDMDRPGALPGYAWKRFVRVYPIYWLFSLLYVGAALAGMGDASFSWAPIHVAENIALVHVTPEFIGPPLKVGWTLFYEIRFYILFGLAILSRRLAAAVFALWLVGTVLAPSSSAFGTEFFSLWNFAFLFGMAGAYGSRHLDARWWKPALVLGAVVLVLTFAWVDPLALKDKRSLLILPASLGFAALMLGLALLERTRELRVGRLPLLLGNASYAIYLVHSAVISAAVAIQPKLPVLRDVPPWAMFLPILVAAVAAGVIAHLAIEKPLLRRLRWPARRRDAEAALPA
jgi:exopolysaccharide production protein ExoZ